MASMMAAAAPGGGTYTTDAVAKLDGDPPLEHEERFVLVLMRVPVKDFAELGDLDLAVVDVAGDMGLPYAFDGGFGGIDQMDFARNAHLASAGPSRWVMMVICST